LFASCIDSGKLEEELLMCMGYLERVQVKTYCQQWTRGYRIMDYRARSVLAFVLKGLRLWQEKIQVFSKSITNCPHINFTHCIIHGEILVSKTLDQQLNLFSIQQ